MATQCYLNITPSAEPILCRWIDEVKKKYPRYVSVFAREALLHYITNGTCLNLGSVPDNTSGTYQYTRNNYTITISANELIMEWRQFLKSKGYVITQAMLQILNDSITVTEEGSEVYIKSYSELMSIPSFKDRFKANAASEDLPSQKSIEPVNISDTVMPYSSSHPEDKPVIIPETVNHEPLQDQKPKSRRIGAAFAKTGIEITTKK